MGNIKNTNRYIKFRTDCVEKQADLLLKEVLNYYNIPIRSSNERILSIDYYNPVERILKLSYSKESKVNNKGEIYAINITLIECVGANFVKYDYKNGNSLYNMYIDEFLVTVNGRKMNTSLKILKELNDEVLLKIDKPFNLGNPILINNEDWHDVVILAPIKGFKSEKIDILKKSFISNKDFILSYIKRYLKEKYKYNDDLICDDFKISIEYNGKDRYEDYESYVL